MGKIAEIEAGLEGYNLPSDGLVLFFDDVAYGDSLGSTAHHPRNGIAFKWQDETAATRLTGVLWSPSRTGRLNPVAVFDPVELEGTTVSRASLHNVTVMEETLGRAYAGQEVTVYKANMIIPVVLSGRPAESDDEEWLEIPERCPVCGEPTERKVDNDAVLLYCPNDECPAKHEGAFTHFVSRDAMNIMGLSKETLSKMMEAGVVASFADILSLPGKHDEVVGVVEGIKEKSFANIAEAVEAAKKTEARRFLYALGMREVGTSTSRDICQAYGNDIEAIIEDVEAGRFERLGSVSGVGEVVLDELREYFGKNAAMVRGLLASVEITDLGEAEQAEQNDFVSGKTFVITGEASIFSNCDEFKAYVESKGGKVSGSVSGKTSYLVTNDPGSGSSKNRKAQELGVPIITEAQFCETSGRSV